MTHQSKVIYKQQGIVKSIEQLDYENLEAVA